MLIRCGWLDARQWCLVSTPVVVPSAYYFAEMVRLEFLPRSGDRIIKARERGRSKHYDVAVHALIPHNWFSNFGRPSTYFYWLVIKLAFPKIIWMLHGGLVDSVDRQEESS